MTIREIPQAFLHKCDLCGKEHTQASRHRSAGWHQLKWDADALDYQGGPVGSAAFERLLCPDCGGLVRDALNKVKP